MPGPTVRDRGFAETFRQTRFDVSAEQMSAVCVPLAPAHPSDKRHLTDQQQLASGSPRVSLRAGLSQDVRNTSTGTIIHSSAQPRPRGNRWRLAEHIMHTFIPACETCLTEKMKRKHTIQRNTVYSNFNLVRHYCITTVIKSAWCNTQQLYNRQNVSLL